ncbi:hypothetical protein L210DRAFT_3533359 [Boletus edulis BED1]|uniref:Uncharacterized protein n=1 Tax=Boletus edulis BED1 TaxID=1328754 RepID=A0AAD4BZ55_BOLED|nr:hypothetical protein L210DRAFT_3533359 [Boletus edulis BED1]
MPDSVHGVVPFVTRTNTTPERIPVVLLHHSDKDASSVGHAEAGVFWDDAWLLFVTSIHVPIDLKFGVEKNFASRVRSKYHRRTEHVNRFRTLGTTFPEPRGCFPSASYVCHGKTRVVPIRGLLSSNERSGQVWVGDVDIVRGTSTQGNWI